MTEQPSTPPTDNPDQNPSQHTTRRPAMHPLIARGLIRDEHGRWLVVRPTGGGYWHLPGGRVEQDEPLRAACAREIREELALDLTPGALIAVGWTAPRRAGRHARVTFIFDMGVHPAAVLDEGVVLQLSELSDWRWAPAREALTILHPDVAVRMAAYRGSEPTAVYTEHHPRPDTSGSTELAGMVL